jgi:hypothetical protein
MRLLRCCCAVVLFIAPVAFGQQVVVGSIRGTGLGAQLPGAGARTAINLSHPADRAGSVGTVALHWGVVPTPASCTANMKIKFFRRGLASAAGTMTLVAERGPFGVQLGTFAVQLTPPVTVEAGDLLGVTQLNSNNVCGSVMMATAGPRETILVYQSDFAGGNFATNATLLSAFSLNARASTTASAVTAVVPVVGSAQGVGSFFRTEIQAVNPGNQLMSGKYVFHPAGRSALPTDPSLNYQYGSGAVFIPDIVGAMGASGLGSLDIIPERGVAPQLLVRVFSDAGAAGTAGFISESVPIDDAINAAGLPEAGSLVAPNDLTNFRMNVGIRTLEAGATVTVANFQGSTTRTYPPNFFEQSTLAAFIGQTPSPNFVYFVRVTSGSAIVYTTTTDNRTGDTAMQILRRPD